MVVFRDKGLGVPSIALLLDLFHVGSRHWEYNPTDQDDTLGIPTVWTTPENLREFFVHASRG